MDYTNHWMSAYVNVLQSNHNIQLSKALSYILRHGAAKEGLQMTQGNKKRNLLNIFIAMIAMLHFGEHRGAYMNFFFYIGFIFVDDLLKLRQFQRYSENDVKKVVAENDKKRFALRNDPETDRLQIRANQGHTMEVSMLTLYTRHLFLAPM